MWNQSIWMLKWRLLHLKVTVSIPISPTWVMDKYWESFFIQMTHGEHSAEVIPAQRYFLSNNVKSTSGVIRKLNHRWYFVMQWLRKLYLHGFSTRLKIYGRLCLCESRRLAQAWHQSKGSFSSCRKWLSVQGGLRLTHWGSDSPQRSSSLWEF